MEIGGDFLVVHADAGGDAAAHDGKLGITQCAECIDPGRQLNVASPGLEHRAVPFRDDSTVAVNAANTSPGSHSCEFFIARTTRRLPA